MRVSMGTFDCTNEDVLAVENAMKSGFLSIGRETREVEKKLAKRHGKKYGLMVSSGQSALEVSIICAKYKLQKPKLKIIVPSLTYSATLWAVLNCSCEPVFVDIDKDYNINCGSLPEADVLLSVDLCGKTATIPEKVKSKYFIIEDACEACGNSNCSYGDIVCSSFYVSHIITGGSGGILMFDDKEILEYAESYISHGRAYGGDFNKNWHHWIDKFKFDKVGASCRSNNLSASLVLSQFKRIDEIIDLRKMNAMLLSSLIKKEKLDKYFSVPDEEYIKDCVFQFYPILITDKDINREKLLSYLFENKIDSRVLMSLTNQPIFERLFGKDEKYRHMSSFYVNNYGFLVGCHQGMGKDEMEKIAYTLKNYIKKGAS